MAVRLQGQSGCPFFRLITYIWLLLYCAGVDQYKYGKNRVEADAKRLQAKEDELTKRKQEIRNRLTHLKKERRDLRTAIEANTGNYSNQYHTDLRTAMHS